MEPQTKPTVQVPLRNAHPMKLVYLGTIVAIIIAAAGVYTVYHQTHKHLTKEDMKKIVPTNLFEAQKNGDYKAAQAIRESILNDPNSLPDQKAMVLLGSTRVNFKLTSNVNDILTSIQELKQVFLDTNIDLVTRVLALNKLAFGYCASGRDPLAFAELYKDAPFKNYLVPNDPDASARNLAEWSYSIHPTGFAAVRIARWYSQQFSNDNTLTPERREEYGATARKYLAYGETLHEQEKGDYLSDYKMDPMYVEFYFWRARDTAWLATRGDETYKAKYKQAFEDAIQAALDQNSDSSMNTLAFSRNYYARFMVRLDKDTAAAKVQLDQLSKEMNALPNPLVSSFVRIIRNEHKNHPKGDTWTGIAAMMKLSPDYAASVERVLAIPDAHVSQAEDPTADDMVATIQ